MNLFRISNFVFRVFLFWFSLSLPFLVSCQKAPPRIAVVGGERNAQAIMVERSLKEADARVKTLKGFADAVLVNKDEERRTDLALVVSRPNRIRADAVDTLADVWAAAGSDGKRLWLWLPHKGKLYRGAATPHNLKKLAEFDWELPELIAIISGVVPYARNAELVESGSGGKVHYSFKDQPMHLWVDAKTKNPVRLVRYKPPEDTVQYEVNFRNYRSAGEGLFPYDIDVTFPERDCAFYLHYREVDMNASVDSSIFKPETVWKTQTEEIDKKD